LTVQPHDRWCTSSCPWGHDPCSVYFRS
jgi:hypothetical protein